MKRLFKQAMGKQWLWGSLLGLVMVLPGAAQTTTPTEPSSQPTYDYTQAMNLGYTYADESDYQTALVNFRRALDARPDDVYAMNAIANMEYYIERNRVAILQSEVDELHKRLNSAAEGKDWVCVVATVDQLIPYAEGLERERLTGYRSQLTGILESRTDVEFWSTVCSPNEPVQ